MTGLWDSFAELVRLLPSLGSFQMVASWELPLTDLVSESEF
jgi:hypothetical protein